MNMFIISLQLEYPEELHDLHDQLPLAPSQETVTFDGLSPHAKRLYEKFYPERKCRLKEKKLMATLENKKDYVTHVANLKLYLELGLKVKKIKRVISFRQKRFLDTFINHITNLRSKAKTPFEIFQMKLIANSSFGKFIEDVFKYMTTKIVQNDQDVDKYVATSNFSSFTIINEFIVALHSKPKSVTLNKGYAVGFTILEFAKFIMYSLLYKIILPNCPNYKILMHDTDSFLASIKGMSSEEFHSKLQNNFDFSKYPTEHPLFSTEHKNHLFLLKDELEGKKKIEEFIGLRSKCYSYRTSTNNKISESKICKGIKKNVIKKDLTFSMYKQCLKNEQLFRAEIVNIQSKNHLVQTIKQKKIALSSFDSKRYLLDCGTHSYAVGHWRTKALNNICPICN